jgi:hypothetical protein
VRPPPHAATAARTTTAETNPHPRHVYEAIEHLEKKDLAAMPPGPNEWTEYKRAPPKTGSALLSGLRWKEEVRP